MKPIFVLDTGALIAIERRSTRIQSLLEYAKAQQTMLVLPTVVVAQAVRGGPRQVHLNRFLNDAYLKYVGFDYETAWEVGKLLGESGTSDVIDAAVVVTARAHGRCPVVTSVPGDIAKLDNDLEVIAI